MRAASFTYLVNRTGVQWDLPDRYMLLTSSRGCEQHAIRNH